jgi:hypothetical protein
MRHKKTLSDSEIYRSGKEPVAVTKEGSREGSSPRKQNVDNIETIDLLEKRRDLNEKIYQDNNGWNHNLEMIAARIGERSSGLRWMHKRASRYFNTRYQILGLVCILVQTGAATAAVTQVSTCSAETSIITILVSIFMYLTAVLTSFNQFKNYGARTQNHKQAEADFSGVEEMIRIELGKYRRDRKIGYDYTEWVAARFDQVNVTSPEIPGSIETKYKEFIIGKKIADASDAIDPIDIKGNNDSPQNLGITTSPTPPHEYDSIPLHPPHPPLMSRNSIVNIEVGKEQSSSKLMETGEPAKGHIATKIDTDLIEFDEEVLHQDVIIDFVPKLERDREMYEIQRFLHGDNK